MNRIKASLGITVLLVASLGLTAPTQAAETASLTAPSVVSVEAPEATLNFDEVSVITIPAPEPVAVEEPAPVTEVEPAPVVEAPAPAPETVTVPEPVPAVEEETAPEGYPAPPVVPNTTEETVVAPPEYNESEGGRRLTFQGDGSDALKVFTGIYFGSYRGAYVAGYPPTTEGYTWIPGTDPSVIHVFVTAEMNDAELAAQR